MSSNSRGGTYFKCISPSIIISTPNNFGPTFCQSSFFFGLKRNIQESFLEIFGLHCHNCLFLISPQPQFVPFAGRDLFSLMWSFWARRRSGHLWAWAEITNKRDLANVSPKPTVGFSLLLFKYYWWNLPWMVQRSSYTFGFKSHLAICWTWIFYQFLLGDSFSLWSFYLIFL